MLKRSAIAVIMLLVSLVGACAPQTGGPTPTPAGTSAVPKATSGAVSVDTPKPVAEKPQRGGTLTYAMSGEAGELDPHKPSSGVTRRWARLLYNSLVNTNEKGELIPELAESWSYPDLNTVELKLRKNVKFHDGMDFNAQAVKFNVERIQDPATKAFRRTALGNITSVEVVDPYTVRLHLKTPQVSVLATFADTMVAMVSPAAVAKWGDQFILHPVGTGPFEFVEWVKGDHMTAKRFDGYWRKDEFGDPLPYLDQVVIKPIPDATVRLTNLRTGAVDLMDSILPAQVVTVNADKSLKTVDWGNALFEIYLSCVKPPFDNKALRQAVAWAIDRDAIHKAIYGGTGKVADYYLDPRTWAFDPNGSFYTRDLAKAKAKLAEGGQPNGFKFTAKDYNTDLELRVAQALKAQLAEAGIDMEIVPIEETKLGADRTSGNYEAIFTKASGLEADPDSSIYTHFRTGMQENYGKCGTPAIDEVLDKTRGVYDQAQRKAHYAKAQALILDDSTFIFLHHSVITSAMSQKVMGFTPNIDIYNLQLDWFWLKK